MVAMGRSWSPGRYPGLFCSVSSAASSSSRRPGLTVKNRLNSLVEPTMMPGWCASVEGLVIPAPLSPALHETLGTTAGASQTDAVGDHWCSHGPKFRYATLWFQPSSAPSSELDGSGTAAQITAECQTRPRWALRPSRGRSSTRHLRQKNWSDRWSPTFRTEGYSSGSDDWLSEPRVLDFG